MWPQTRIARLRDRFPDHTANTASQLRKSAPSLGASANLKEVNQRNKGNDEFSSMDIDETNYNEIEDYPE